MAAARQCDFCGKFSLVKDRNFYNIDLSSNITGESWMHQINNFDICSDCFDRVIIKNLYEEPKDE